MEQYSDEELMEMYCKGSYQAFEILMQRYKRRLFTFVNSLLGVSNNLAEEVFQETFLRIVRVNRFGSYFRKAKFSTYLFTIARNICYDCIRRKHGAKFVSLDDETKVIPLPTIFEDKTPDTPENIAIRNQQQQLINDAMAELPSEQREVIYLRINMDMQFKEIAKIAGISENTAKSRYRYAVDTLVKFCHSDKNSVSRSKKTQTME